MSKIGRWETLADEPEALAALAAHGLDLDLQEGLFDYCRLLQDFNAHTNLVSDAAMPVLLKQHVLDSLMLLSWFHGERQRSSGLIDIGTGAGFPGIVLAVALPFLKVTLIESINKKCDFLETTISELGLSSRARVICGRAETLSHEKSLREKYDFATARAVGALPVVTELCIPFLRVGGLLLAQRSSRQSMVEQPEANSYAHKLGGSLKEAVDFDADLLGRRLSLLVFEKQRSTPPKYARAAAQMKHEPLHGGANKA